MYNKKKACENFVYLCVWMCVSLFVYLCVGATRQMNDCIVFIMALAF